MHIFLYSLSTRGSSAYPAINMGDAAWSYVNYFKDIEKKRRLLEVKKINDFKSADKWPIKIDKILEVI